MVCSSFEVGDQLDDLINTRKMVRASQQCLFCISIKCVRDNPNNDDDNNKTATGFSIV